MQALGYNQLSIITSGLYICVLEEVDSDTFKAIACDLL